MKRARPQGLGSVTKKDKPEEEHEVVAEAPVDAVTEGTGKLIYELPEDATALDQVRALFESATMFLGNYQHFLLYSEHIFYR